MATLLSRSNFSGRYGSHYFYAVYYDYTQDIANNRTTFTFYGYIGGDSYASASGTAQTCYIDGKAIGTFTSITANSNKLIGSTTKVVNHNADGTFPGVTISAYCNTNWTNVNNASLSGTITSANIPTIPRASTVGCSDFYIESGTNIVINSASSNFRHTLKYNFGSLSGTIAEKTALTTYAWTPDADEFYTQIPNSQQLVGTITCETYNNNTLLGTKTCNFTARIDTSKNKPDVSLTVIDVNDVTKALTGNENTLVKYFSNVEAKITANAKNHATIKSYLINNINAEQVTTINNIETNKFTAKVIDSRDIDNTEEVTTDFVDYIKLAIKSLEIERTAPTSGQVRLDLDGFYYNGSFGQDSNTLTVKVRYKQQYGEWSEYKNLTTAIENNTFSLTEFDLNTLFDNASFDYQKAYTFEIVINDKLMTVNQEILLKRGLPLVAYGEDFVHIYGDLELMSGNVVLDYETIDEFNDKKSIKLKDGFYWDSSNIIHNKKILSEYLNNTIEVIDSKVFETQETLNKKKVYGYRLTFSQAINKNTQYIFELPFANDIDIAWVDLGNSFTDNHKSTANFNTWSLGSIAGFQFQIGIITKNQLSIKCDDNWTNLWTFNIMIKFTKK